MANTGFKGVDVRQSGTALLFRASLKDSSGTKLTTGTTTLRLYEIQSDGTLKSYDFNDNTFKTGSLTTETASMTHRQGNSNTYNTGVWTYALATLTGFTRGADYLTQVTNSGASPTEQEREFVYGSAEGDLVVDAAGLADANMVKVGPTGSGTAQTARDIGASVLLSSGTGTGQLKLASGYVAMTWADIAAPTTSVNLSGTTIATVTNQLTAAAIATGVWQDTTAGDFTTALSIGKSIMNGVSLGTGLTVARCTLTDTLTTYTGNTVQTGDSYAIVNSGTFGNSAIKGYVDDIGVAGAGLTSIPDSAGVTTLLSRLPAAFFAGITSLAQWLGLIAGKQTGNSTARTEIRATGAGSGTFDETTDSVEALRDRGDAAWVTATGFSTLDAAGVRTAVGLATANLDTQIATLATSTAVAAIQADLPQRITKNTALSGFPFFMVLASDHLTGATGLTVTATRSIDGGAFGACTNAVSEIANGVYKLDLSASDLNGNVIMLKLTAATADARFITIVTEPT